MLYTCSDVVKAVQEAHSKYEERRKQEKEEEKTRKDKEKQNLAEVKRQAAVLEHAQKKQKTSIGKKSVYLQTRKRLILSMS